MKMKRVKWKKRPRMKTNIHEKHKWKKRQKPVLTL